jgi:FkbM family methyltransferase
MALTLQYDEARVIADYFAQHPRTGTMIDVGAHFGTSFRQYLNQGWRVVAFEPDSTKHEKLRPYQSNPLFTFFPEALADQPREDVQFYTSPESTGIASLVAFRSSHTPAEKVAVTTLSLRLHALQISSIDYLKIDTEGYDLQVLRGHDWSIQPELIMCEFDEIKTRPQGFGYRKIGDLLLSHDYAVYCSQWAPLVRYGSGHAWHSIRRYPCDLHHADAWGNFIAIHRENAHEKTLKDLIAPHL